METEYKRKLASVQQISRLSKHNNADSLEIAELEGMGWQVVVKKNEFKEGDLVVYLEIDSLCPKTEWSAFLEKVNYRVKTIRLRGQLSQGLILSLSILQKESKEIFFVGHVGQDVSEILGITKYESAEESDRNKKRGLESFPIHLGFIKTDEPRIQSEPKYLKLFKDQKVYGSLKYDGCSTTFFIHPETGKFSVCSRNYLLELSYEEDPNCPQLQYVHLHPEIEVSLRKFPHLVLQGELYGPKINKNNLQTKELKFVVFSIFNMQTRKYCNMYELQSYCKELGMEMVAIVFDTDSFDIDSVARLLELAKGKYPGTKNDREGIVFRLKETMYLEGGVRGSYKVINNDFLEKEK